MSYTNGLDNPELYFQTKLYTGNGGTQSITFDGSENMQPDWVWIKNRSGADQHSIYDSVRGANKVLRSNSNASEGTQTDGLTSFDSDGFSVGASGSVNTNSNNFVSWNWKAGTSFTNDASATSIGTIDSTGSASDTSGFSIVSYRGTGSAGTIKHGLSSVPKVIICKNRDTAENWITYHEPLGAGKFLRLNQTNAETTSSNFWNDTTPTSSVFSVATGITVNNSGDDIIAYCFTEKKGYSKFGSYTGNGNADGTYVHLGFKPAFFICKRTSDAGYDWLMYDNKRQVSFNVIDDFLKPNLSDAETTGNANQSLDFLSNGVKHRGNGASSNGSGASYIYMAFAENPFVNSNGVPNNAR